MKVRVIITMLLVLVALLSLVGCKAKEDPYEKDKIKDLEFTVVEDEDLPEVLADRIEEEKMEPFKFSYSDGEYIYIVITYGEQPTGGYSIQVTDLYQTDKYIIISTELLGPAEDEMVATVLTYPYIVIKTEDLKMPIGYK